MSDYKRQNDTSISHHSGREVLRRKGMVRLGDINITENMDTTYPTAVKFDTKSSLAGAKLKTVQSIMLLNLLLWAKIIRSS